jgi:hypothetical protein
VSGAWRAHLDSPIEQPPHPMVAAQHTWRGSTPAETSEPPMPSTAMSSPLLSAPLTTRDPPYMSPCLVCRCSSRPSTPRYLATSRSSVPWDRTILIRERHCSVTPEEAASALVCSIDRRRLNLA